MAEDRYDRQKRIEGWNQTNLDNAKIALVGSGPLANFTGTLISALGIGKIDIYDNSVFEKYDPGEFLLADSLKGEQKIRGLEKSLKEINPTIDVESYQWKFLREYYTDILDKPSIIIDTTNNPFNEAALFSYAVEHNIPLVNGSAGIFQGELSVFRPENYKTLENEIPYELLSDKYDESMQQDPIISSIIAGLITDEVRKILMPLKTKLAYDESGAKTIVSDEPSLSGKLIYDTLTSDLVKVTNSAKPNINRIHKPFEYRTDVNAHIVGAGSLGNVVGLLLATIGVEKIVVYDKDEYEDINLNRQILAALYGSDVGKSKSPSLANKLQKVNPYIKAKGKEEFFNRNMNFSDNKMPDVIFDCVDRYVGMEEADEFSKMHNVPVISGHTDYKQGQAFFSDIQNGYECLNGRLMVSENAEIERNPTSCIASGNPSVIISNWIIGSLMADLFRVAFSKSGIKPTNKRINYDTFLAERISITDQNVICRYKDSTDEKNHNNCPYISKCNYEV